MLDSTGVIKSEIFFQEHTGELIHRTSQPTERLILERNAELRRNKGAIQDLGAQSGESFGRMVADIPFIKYNKAIRDGYQLNHRDAEFRAKEMMRYLKSEDGLPCLVTEKL